MFQENFTIKQFNGRSAFEDLRADWELLWQESNDASHFQLWDWQFLYCTYVVPNAIPHFVALYDSAGRCRIISALIKTRDPQSGLMVAGFIGGMRSDYNMFLVGKDVSESAGVMLFRFLLNAYRFSASALKLINVPAESWTGRVISTFHADNLINNGLVNFQLGESHTVLLPSTLEEYLTGLGSRSRRDFGYDRRRLEKECKTKFMVYEGIEEIERVMDYIESIDLSRWKSESMYLRPQRRELERGVVRALAEHGCLLVFLLFINEKPAAFAWGALVRGVVEVDRIAYDPTISSKVSVGKVTNFYAIEECIRRGYLEFDLTRGGEMYKGWLKATPRKLINFMVYRSRLDRTLQLLGGRFLAILRKQESVRQAYRKLFG